MPEKVHSYLAQIVTFVRRLRDVRFVGQVVFVVLVLLMSWSGIKAIQTNYGLQKQISALQQQNQVQQLENNNLKLQNDYYNSDQYLELAARQSFGLGQAGETEVTIPRSVALAHTVPMPGDSQKDGTTAQNQPAYQRNFQAWVDFFLHRQAPN